MARLDAEIIEPLLCFRDELFRISDRRLRAIYAAGLGGAGLGEDENQSCEQRDYTANGYS